MKSKFNFVVVLLILAILIPAAFASPEDAKDHSLSITFSPIHLLFPIGFFTIEFPLDEQLSFAAMVGAGSITQEVTTSNGLFSQTEKKKFPIWSLGAQGRYYFTGNFNSGVYGGLYGNYLHISLDDAESDIAVDGNGVQIGPMIGSKFLWGSTFIFDAAIGYTILLFSASANDSDGTEASQNASDSGILLVLNIGFSI